MAESISTHNLNHLIDKDTKSHARFMNLSWLFIKIASATYGQEDI